MNRLKSVTIIIGTILALVLLTRPLTAGIYLNTIDPEASLHSPQQYMLVTGPIGCDVGETYQIRVRVTQVSTGATAEGMTSDLCTGDRQPWRVRTQYTNYSFVKGDAHAEAWAETIRDEKVTDERNWEVDITLVEGKLVFLPLLIAKQ